MTITKKDIQGLRENARLLITKEQESEIHKRFSSELDDEHGANRISMNKYVKL